MIGPEVFWLWLVICLGHMSLGLLALRENSAAVSDNTFMRPGKTGSHLKDTVLHINCPLWLIGAWSLQETCLFGLQAK